LEFKSGAHVTNFPDSGVPVATASKVGGVKIGSGLSVAADGTLSADGITPSANQEDSTAEDVAGIVTDFNALLSKLKAAGLMTADTEESGT
jgi:hypothetical protein